MKRWMRSGLAAIAVSVVISLAVAWSAWASAVNPGVGAIGFEIDLTGIAQSDFAPKKKPKVELVPNPAFPVPVVTSVKTKVLEFAPDRLRIRVTQGLAGGYSVLVTPAEKTTAFNVGSFFFIGLPTPTSLEPPAGSVKSTVLVRGSLFGTAKGSVTIGGMKAKVKGWSNELIEVVVPKKLDPGPHAVVVTNKSGKSLVPLSFNVEETQPGGYDEYLDAEVEGHGRVRVVRRGPIFLVHHVPVTRQITVTGATKASHGKTVALSVIPLVDGRATPYDVGTLPTPEFQTIAVVTFNYDDTKVSIASGGSPGSAMTLTVTRWDGTYFQGSFHGTLIDGVGGGTAPIQIEGTFRVRAGTPP